MSRTSGAAGRGFASRYGAGRVIAGAGVAYVAGLIGMSLVSTPIGMHLNSGLLIGMALGGTSFGIILAVIGRTVPPEKRSFGMGIATAAGSFGQFALLPVTQFLITRFDWHVALLAMAGIVALIVPLAGALAGKPVASAGTPQSIGGALHEAPAEKGFHLLFWGYFVCGFHI